MVIIVLWKFRGQYMLLNRIMVHEKSESSGSGLFFVFEGLIRLIKTYIVE